MRTFLRSMKANFGAVGELLAFFGSRKRQWFLIPMVVALLVIGLLVIFAAASGVGPFIYTLF